jgi:LysM repeat protein
MRRYVEDKDFLDSYVRRENRSMENEGKGKPRATGSFKQPEDTIPYTVKRGETLSGIAVCNNMSTFHLKTLNRLGSGMLFPGQVLYIPARQESRTYVTCCSSKESAPSSSKMSDGDSTVDESVAPIVECQENVFSSNAEAEKRKSEHTGMKLHWLFARTV